MNVSKVAALAAILCCTLAVAQTGPPPAAPLPLPQVVAPPDGGADIWSRMTPEQRRQLWQQMTPEERAAVWKRLPPEQRRAIRERWQGAGQAPGGPGPKLSPEERRRLREEIRDAHRERGRGRP